MARIGGATGDIVVYFYDFIASIDPVEQFRKVLKNILFGSDYSVIHSEFKYD